MRIGIDVRPSQTGAGRRGLGAYTFSVVEGLVRFAPEHEYVLIALPDVRLPDQLLRVSGPDAPCRVVTLATPRVPWDAVAARYLKVWRLYFRAHHAARRRALERLARRERLDVLHLPVPVMVQLRYLVDARGRRAGCPVVKTLHDVTPLVLQDEIEPTLSRQQWYSYVEQLGWYRDADLVVAISTSARDDAVEHLGLDPDRVTLVPCAIPEAYRPVTDRARAAAVAGRHGIRHPYFLVVSGNGVNKNYPRVLEAFAHAAAAARAAGREIQLVLAGPLSNGATARLKALAFDLGLGRDQLLWLGYVPEEDLVALFAGARALVSASLYEGFGLPAAQAMRMGTPVIASDRASFPEVVGDAGLLVDPYRVDAIAAAMERLACADDLVAFLAARGRERAARFGSEQQARRLVEAYAAAVRRA